MADASLPEIAPLPAVMSTEEVSELLGLTPKWTLRLAREGHLPGHQVPNGRRWVFRSDEVLDAISSWSDASADGSAQCEHEAEPPSGAAPPESIAASSSTAAAPEAISCAAPSRGENQTDAEWLAECRREWIAAAASVGVIAKPAKDNLVVADEAEYVLTIGHSEVAVLDDFADERLATLHSVSVVRRDEENHATPGATIDCRER